MTMHKALHLRDDIEKLQVKKEGENDSPGLKIVSRDQYKDSVNTRERALISVATNSNRSRRTKTKIIKTRERKIVEKQ